VAIAAESRSERLAGALIDRLTDRVHVVEIQGDSYRLQASLKAKKGGGVPKTPKT
jgi:DNA replication protein DnaC